MSRFTNHLSIAWKLILAVPMFVACARSATTIRTAPSATPRSFETAIVSVRSADAGIGETERKQFETMVVALLLERRVAPNIVLGESSTGRQNAMVIDLAITGVRKVGGLQRALFGAFAGRASMAVDVAFRDGADPAPFAEFTVKGETGSTGYAGTSTEAIARAAQEVANLVALHIRAAPNGTPPALVPDR